MSGAGGLGDDLARLASLVFTARRLLAGGALVDLSAIEERVREVCGTVAAMPPDEGRGLVGDLQSLIGKLDRLGEDLRDRLDRFAGPAGTITTQG
ncbi:MAG TPA: hypothetical protein HPQ04_13070 [Rhodospirillaceae bacterium]|nr:hypothetical protein [Rhodospirillaceae bacterium]